VRAGLGDFTVAQLHRQRERQSVLVKWEGKPIGAATSGQRSLEVPARGSFLVTQEQVLDEGGRRQILVYFSDALDPAQDLTGLVHLSQGTVPAPVQDGGPGGVSAHIQDGALVVYPRDDSQGQVTLTVEAGIRNERGDRLEQAVQQTLSFPSLKPQVRFLGRGVIAPDGKTLTIPRRLGCRQYQPLHGCGMGGQCQRRGPAGAHRGDRRGAPDVRAAASPRARALAHAADADHATRPGLPR
jgi:alpha-2-macroglobulin